MKRTETTRDKFGTIWYFISFRICCQEDLLNCRKQMYVVHIEKYTPESSLSFLGTQSACKFTLRADCRYVSVLLLPCFHVEKAATDSTQRKQETHTNFRWRNTVVEGLMSKWNLQKGFVVIYI